MLQWKSNPLESDLNTIQYLNNQNKLDKGMLSNIISSAKEHLVQVQKTVTRAGKTFLQNFWVDPDDNPSAERIQKTANMLGSVNHPGSPFQVWNKSLSNKEYNYIKEYTGDTFYKELNSLLRFGKVTNKAHLVDYSNDDLKERAAVIEQALDRFDLPQDITTFRIMSDGFKEQLEVGDLFHDKGFTSTSLSRWAKTQEGYTFVKIRIPKGKGRGAWVAPMSWVAHEQEFLLNRGTQFRVTQVKKNPDGSQYIECDVVNREPGNLDEIQKSMKSNKAKSPRLNRFTWAVDDIEIIKAKG